MSTKYTQLSFLSRVRARSRGSWLLRSLTVAVLFTIMLVTVKGSSEPESCLGTKIRNCGHLNSVDRDALKEFYEELEDSFMCPITCDYMTDPVMTADGHTYERWAIERWFDRQGDGPYRSPKTNARLAHRNTLPNHALRKAIQEYIKTIPVEERPEPVASRPEEPAADSPEPTSEAPPPPVTPGVRVTRAGYAQANGWYTRKEAAETPRGWSLNWGSWDEHNWGRHWYAKDDDCFIYYDVIGNCWFIRSRVGRGSRYYSRLNPYGAAPPTHGWVACSGSDELSPAPTLQVMNH